MSTVVSLERPEIQRTLGRSAVYQLLALAFSYPDAESLDELRVLVEDVAEHSVATDFSLGEDLQRLAEALSRVHLTELCGEHSFLFSREVPCSAHESEYAFDPFAKSRQLADIAGFYQAWGLRVAQDHRGLPDFIATELEFMSLVLRKQVYALAQGWSDRSDLSAHAALAFLEDHLGRWVPTFCADVQEITGGAGFFAAAAALCDRFVAEEVRRSGIRPDRVRSRVIPLADTEPFQCGLAPAQDDAGLAEDQTAGAALLPLDWPPPGPDQRR